MATTLPADATKANSDASSDDPAQSILVDLAGAIDKFNALLDAFGAGAQLNLGDGLEAVAQAGGTPDDAEVKIAAAGGLAKGAAGVALALDTLTEETAVDGAADFLALYDAGAGAMRKVKPNNLGAQGGLVLLATVTANDDATVDFTTAIDGTYDHYLITARGVVPATDAVNLHARVSVSGGFKSGASDYAYQIREISDGAAYANINSTGDTKILFTNFALGSGSGESWNGVLHMFNPANATLNTLFTIDAVAWAASPVNAGYNGMARYAGVEAVDGVRFLMSSGNIHVGDFALYGLRNA